MPIVAAYRNNKRSRSVQLVARKNTHKNHRTSFRAEVKSFVHQDARDNMGKMPHCANVKQCKLKAWGVAVVDLWLFFEYHAEVKV